MMSSSPTRWLGIVLMAGCGVAGYMAGTARISGKKSAGFEHNNSRTERPQAREKRSEESPFENFKRLLAGGGGEADTWKAVSRLEMADLPEALRQLRAARFLTASGNIAETQLNEIESALYYRWAESDPTGALADVSAMPGPPDRKADLIRAELMKNVLAAWMKTDATAAYRAVKDHPDFSSIGRNMWVQTWTAENVFENLKLFPDKHRDLLGWYCYAAVHDEGQRNAMLTALKEQPEMKDRDWGYELLFREWGHTDVPAAMTEAKKYGQPELEQNVLEAGLTAQPATTLPWAVSQGIPPGGQRWNSGYLNWLYSDAAAAQKWLEEQAPAWQKDGYFAAVADFRTQQLGLQEKIDMEVVQPVWLALMTDWKNKDPDGAEKWLNGPTARSQGISHILNWKGADAHE